ncbi:uncharacterized protein LOC135461515 [Liolophura sinensis]|uniref:uncharacterized protein LOC135461515 n=1 Tax=Liolophura sinensis TaxID=3198878 RepID=UPI003158CC2B
MAETAHARNRCLGMSGIKIGLGPPCPHRREYNAAKVRIDQALETLKRELKSMRDQDVALLKHLITISETIRKLARGRSNIRTNQRTIGRSGGAVAVVEGRARLIRQMSEPHDCRIIPKDEELTGLSVGSLEDYIGDYVDDFSISSLSELEDSTPSLQDICLISRTRSISFLTPAARKDADSPTTNNSVYEEILRRNIVLWKNRLPTELEAKNDSVFYEEEEDLCSYSNVSIV